MSADLSACRAHQLNINKNVVFNVFVVISDSEENERNGQKTRSQQHIFIIMIMMSSIVQPNQTYALHDRRQQRVTQIWKRCAHIGANCRAIKYKEKDVVSYDKIAVAHILYNFDFIYCFSWIFEIHNKSESTVFSKNLSESILRMVYIHIDINTHILTSMI